MFHAPGGEKSKSLDNPQITETLEIYHGSLLFVCAFVFTCHTHTPHRPEHTDTLSTKLHTHVSNENSVDDRQSSIVPH